jgi:flagellar biosynthesis protein FliQ
VDEGTASALFAQGVSLLILLSLPAIGMGLLIGLLISLFQAVTQIQEQTLTFVPKMITVLLVLSIMFPWMVSRLSSWIVELWSGIPGYVL